MLHQYFNGNVLLILAVIALLYWSRKNINRTRYIACVGILLMLLLNNLCFRLVVKIGETETFYRVLWMLPVTILAAYLIIEMCGKLSGWKRAVLIVTTGYLVMAYAVPNWNNWIKLPSNVYQLEDEVIAIADLIEDHSGGARVNIIDDYSVSLYIREYDDNLCEPGGEDYILRQIIYENCVDYTKEEIVDAAWEAWIDYIILPKTRTEAKAAFERAKFTLIGSSDNYNIYYTNR
jgi:hypothetical protein